MLKRRLSEYFKFLKSLMRTNRLLLWGMWKLTKLPQPAITVFGGSRVPLEGKAAQDARKIGYMLAREGFSIITGGGPGIMESANMGAVEYVSENLKECKLNGEQICKPLFISAGINLIKLNKERTNPYVQDNIMTGHFFARKWLLVRYSVGFVVFPGGFGTMDELFEVVTLIQCNRMSKVPIVLMHKDYWAPLELWIRTRALENNLINPEDTNIISITDSVEEAVNIITTRSKKLCESVLQDETTKR
ncbi:MAG: TIGR00730 family Rossman fold protein [Candidatus Babeliales bacterium]